MSCIYGVIFFTESSSDSSVLTPPEETTDLPSTSLLSPPTSPLSPPKSPISRQYVSTVSFCKIYCMCGRALVLVFGYIFNYLSSYITKKRPKRYNELA